MESSKKTQRSVMGWPTNDAWDHLNAATMPNEYQQPVRNKHVKSTTTVSGCVVHRVAASPRQMKTQIAKISYSPARPSKAVKIENSRKPLTTFVQKIHSDTTLTSPQTADSRVHTKEEYEKRKHERHREIQEIQSMLKEMSKSPIKVESKVSENVVRKPQRSNTVAVISRPKTAVTRREQKRTYSASRARSKSSQPPATKSHELLPENSKEKKRSYNVEEARQFMEEQKRKRRSNPASIPQIHPNREKVAFEKEQIRKRLEELRKNSRKIVSKNVSKKLAAQSVDSYRSVGGSGGDGDGDGQFDLISCKDNSKKANKGSPKKATANPDLTIEILYKSNDYKDTARNHEFNNEAAVEVQIPEKSNVAVTENVFVNVNGTFERVNLSQSDTQLLTLKGRAEDSKTASKSNVPLTENQKRIGLLRKPQTKDHSFSAIKEFSFDKENVAIEMLTPRLNVPMPIKSEDPEQPTTENEKEIDKIHQNEQRKELDRSELVSINTINFDAETAPPHITKDILNENIIPEMHCESSKEQELDKTEIIDKQERNELPYWLKPSSIQIYPYNFIMAVRRKLETIAEPGQPGSSDTCIRKAMSISNLHSNTDTITNSIRKKDANRIPRSAGRRIDPSSHYTSSVDSFATHTIERKTVVADERNNLPTSFNETFHRSQTLSDLNSNFSSISIQVPTSHSISEVSSLRSVGADNTNSKKKKLLESKNIETEDDDTTISSSVFNSPKRKPDHTETYLSNRSISPLSLERIENFKITSSNKLKKAIDDKHVNPDRGDVEEQSLCSLKPERSQSKLERNLNFTQLLDDFNRSLSQVIHVNEQLKSTLEKSHHKRHSEKDPKQSNECTLKSGESLEYTNDFECGSDKATVENTIRQQSAENPQYKKPHLDVNNIMKSMLTSPNSNDNDREEKLKSPQLQCNSQTCENSSERNLQSSSNNEQDYKEHESELKLLEQNQQSSQSSSTCLKIKNQDERNQADTKTRDGENEKNENRSNYQEDLREVKLSEITQNSIQNKNQISNMETEIFSAQQTKQKYASHRSKPNHQIHDSTNKQKEIVKPTNKYNNDSSDNSISEEIVYEYSSSKNDMQQFAAAEDSCKANNDTRVTHKAYESAFVIYRGKRKHGDEARSCVEDNSSSSVSLAPPGYSLTVATNPGVISTMQKRKMSSTERSSASQAISNKIVSLLQHSDMNFSMLSSHNDSLSESSHSYTSIGLYEKLIQSEETKSEHLTALLKLREKALLDRTKGQIAWLELQKERYKSKGLLDQIAAVRKKQRGILMKMEREREEIKRLLQSTTTTTSTQSSSKHLAQVPVARPGDTACSQTRRKNNYTQIQHTVPSPTLVSFPPPPSQFSKTARSSSRHNESATATRSAPIIRATYELETSRSLEELLLKRETYLRRRRQHVEQLMQWHQRLDQEENEVLQMERALLNYNNVHQPARETEMSATETQSKEEISEGTSKIAPSLPSPQKKMERRLQEIDESLRELNSISSTNISGMNNDGEKSESADYVRTTGSKLNKLWRRLTSQQIEKFEPSRRYKLCKADLEQLYEEAKVTVLHEFSKNEEQISAKLLERSVSTLNNSQTYLGSAEATSSNVAVPYLNLNFSSEQSEPEECSLAEVSDNSLSLGNYSPSAAEENFRVQVNSNTTVSTSASDSNPNFESKNSPADVCKRRFAQNMETFLAFTNKLVAQKTGLQRSLSDTQIGLRSLLERSLPSGAVSQQSVARAKSPRDLVLKKEESLETAVETGDAQSLKENVLVSSSELTTQHSNSCVQNGQTANGIYSSSVSPKENSELVLPVSNSNNECKEITSHTSITNINYDSTKFPEFEGSFTSISQFTHSQSGSKTDELNSCDFENISTNMQSLNDCVLENDPTLNSNSNETTIATVENFSNINTYENVSTNSMVMNDDKQTTSGAAEVLSAESTNTSSSKMLLSQSTSEKIYEEDFDSDCDETCIDDLSLPHFEGTMDTSENDCVKNETENEEMQQVTSLNELSDTIVEDSFESKENGSQLMPDIINELEMHRCRQIVVEAEPPKQYDQIPTVPYMYVREIPNKPPPPYVPPAHGSPMTTIFPSEERIKDITYRRSHELYCQLLDIEYVNENGEKLPSVMDEKITNIYERIILDICREYLEEHSEVLTQGDPSNFHSQLAFFNPPDRLRCIQESIYKEVRRCLAMDKTSPKRTQVYSVYGQRAKRDHIGKIIIQEMYDEDDKWCNFQREETEVLELIIEELINSYLKKLAEEVLVEEGGTIEHEEEEENVENETNKVSDEVKGTSVSSTLFDKSKIEKNKQSPL